MKKFVAAIIILLSAAAGMNVWGQTADDNRLKVLSFEMKETDMDAKVNAPEEDINGKTCAIIKVETTKQGFSFDTGTISITKTVQKKGEIWVYVSPGIRKFKIFHSDYKPCEYELPIAITPATVYVLNLATPDTQAPGPAPLVTYNFLKFRTNPQECMIRVGKTQNYEADTKRITDGNYSARLNVGKYYYKVEAQFYETLYGEIDLQKNTGVTNLSLTPAYNNLKISSSPESGATIVVKNPLTGHEVSGTTPFSPADKFAKGDYVVTIFHNDYATLEKNITLTGDGTTKEFTYSMTPEYATVTCRCSSPDAQIWIDDEYKATGSWTGRISGAIQHKLEARRENHATQAKAITIANGETKTFTIDAPTPIMAALEVTSTPDMAAVKVDGKAFGETPLVNEIIMGSHKVEVSAKGYQTKEYSITIAEGQTYALVAKLDKVPETGSAGVASAPGGVKTFTVNGVSFNMVYVEGGTFTMGATAEQGADAYDDEKPAHSVTLSSYSIGQTEVTQELWEAVMGENPSYFKGSKNPVETVSYEDCKTFISKLNSLTGQNFRLPTEAEWEYAARGGKYSKGYKYSGSNTIGNVAWYTNNSGSKTHPVATKQANELGLYDMSGNVYEWCSDRYGSYTSSSQPNPQGPSSGSFRVNRGGCWFNAPRYCRVSYRYNYSPGCRDYFLGFRLALP